MPAIGPESAVSVRLVNSLTTAPLPPVGPDDRIRGEGLEAIVYLDLACPGCAIAWMRVRELRLRLAFRHFPIASKHPRGPTLHAAAEAAGLQEEAAFWGMVDSIFSDQGRVDDPHLWDRARRLGLDLERFNRDRRSEPVVARVRRDFEGGIRAGVTGTPAAFAEGRALRDDIPEALHALALPR
jgi:protein-disulfide isomerase